MPLPEFMQPEMQLVVLQRCWPDSPDDRWFMAQIARCLERMIGATAPLYDLNTHVNDPAPGTPGTSQENSKQAVSSAPTQGHGGNLKTGKEKRTFTHGHSNRNRANAKHK